MVFTHFYNAIVLCYILIFPLYFRLTDLNNHLLLATTMHSAIVRASIWYLNVLHIQRRRDNMEEKPGRNKKWKLASIFEGHSTGTAEKLATCEKIY